MSGTLLQSSGTLNGDGTVTITGESTWSGGTQSGTGETIADGGLVLSGTTKNLNGRTMTLNDASTWTAGAVNLRLAGTINNNSSLDIQTDADMSYIQIPPSTFNNNGSITKSAGAALTVIAANFNNNTGTVTVTSGELGFGQAFVQLSTGMLNVTIASGGFDSYTVTQTATLAGTLNISLDAFEPDLTDTFEIMTSSSLGGTEFDSVNGLTIGNGKQFTIT